MLPMIFGSGKYINRGQASEQRNSVHRLSLAFRLVPPCCQQHSAEACKFLCIVFHLGAAWGTNFGTCVLLVGDVLGGPLKYVNVVCLII
eukprot:CCRYP_006245-RA/>CCRYP_006245-RA protein AED:0.13 eAED:0.13 QI:29/1/1/1/0/0/3/20/88